MKPYVITTLLLALMLAIIGLWLGTPQPAGETFGDLLRSFITDRKAQAVLVLVLVDFVCGVYAAIRAGRFDPCLLSRYHVSNVLPYVFCFFVLWSVQPGVNGLVPSVMRDWLIALSFGTIATALACSIASNLNIWRHQP